MPQSTLGIVQLLHVRHLDKVCTPLNHRVLILGMYVGRLEAELLVEDR